MSRENQHHRQTATISELRSIAMKTPRPYTRQIGINGKLRTQTMPVDERVRQSFATNTWPAADRQRREDREWEGVSKSREDELVSFTGTWIPPSK